MPAVVRVKRRIDEEPLSAFVLNGKRRRLDDKQLFEASNGMNVLPTNKDEVSTILKFAGTVRSQDEKATAQIARLTKAEATELAKKHRQQSVDVTERARQETRVQSNESRFKIVNCFRAIDTETADANFKEITIVDIEKHPSMDTPDTQASISSPSGETYNKNQAEMASGSGENFAPTDCDGYVFDLYLPENEQQADNVDYTDNYLSVRAYDEFVFEECYNNEEEEEDSEDSNEENYFRNDYPDEEDDLESVNLREMCRAIESVSLNSYSDGDSSDDELQRNGNGFIFSVDSFDDSFVDDVDSQDVDRYGTAYAKYKKRILRDLKTSDSGDSDFDQHDAVGYICDENSDSE